MTITTSSGRTSGTRAARLAGRALVSAGVVASLLPAASGATAATIPCERVLLVTGPEPSLRFNGPRGIAYDPRHEEVWIANSGDHRIDVFDLAGRRRLAIIHRVRTPDGMEVDGVPNAIALTPEGRLLVVDARATYVDVLDFRGRSVGRIDFGAGSADSTIGGPGALAVSATGQILVASRGPGARVEILAPDFTRSGSWGTTGTAKGNLSGITAVSWLPDGNVVVCCQHTDEAVQVFTPSGEYVRGWGQHDIGEGNFSLASSVVAMRDGRIWIADQIRKVIQVFDSTGVLVGLVSGSGETPVEFLYPSALATDGDHLLAVAESVGNRFQVLRIR